MNNEKEWLEGFRSGHIYKLVDALEVLTPEIAEKYKDEIVANIEEEPSLLMYLPMGIRESWPDVCMLAAEKDPYYICYVPEEYVKNHKYFSFRGLLEKQGSKMEIIVTFLAVLEMMKQGMISIEQEGAFADIMITSSLVA